MQKEVLKFIESNKISVLTTLLENGQPHSAALHFAFSDDPFHFVFLTEKNSRKCQNLLSGVASPASLVVGFNSDEMITLQFEGEVKILSDSELENGWKVYTDKNPSAAGRKTDEKFVLLDFTPNWWRYTELKSNPWKIISSE